MASFADGLPEMPAPGSTRLVSIVHRPGSVCSTSVTFADAARTPEATSPAAGASAAGVAVTVTVDAGVGFSGTVDVTVTVTVTVGAGVGAEHPERRHTDIAATAAPQCFRMRPDHSGVHVRCRSEDPPLPVPVDPKDILSAPLLLIRGLQVRPVGDVDPVTMWALPRWLGAGAEVCQLAVDVDTTGHGIRSRIHGARVTRTSDSCA